MPTGQGLSALRSLNPVPKQVYEVIARRFLAIFYPAAEYQKVQLVTEVRGERFFSGFKVLLNEGYLKVLPQGTADAAKKKADAEMRRPRMCVWTRNSWSS